MQIGKSDIAERINRIMKKILVIRLSSLGDVVLTAPVLSALRNQAGLEVHLLTKPKMGDLLHGGDSVDKFYTWDELDLLSKLSSERYDGILDLHCNFRSYWVRFILFWGSIFLGISRLFHGGGVKILKRQGYDKKRFTRWLYVKTKSSKYQVSHVQQRYNLAANGLLNTLGIDQIAISDWCVGLPEHPLNLNMTAEVPENVKSTTPSNYGVAILGGTYETKKIPKSVWQEIFEHDKRAWYLIGGANETALAAELCSEFGDQLINGVGFFNLETSSRCIALSAVIVGGDTGFTHVAAAYNKPLLVIWGSTDPGLGFAAGNFNNNVLHLVANDLSCHPCSKLGFDACPKGHFTCMMGYSAQEIKLLLQKLQANSLGGH